MAFDGATPDTLPPVPAAEKKAAEAPALSPETLAQIEKEIAEELKEDSGESAAVQASADTLVADQRDHVEGTAEAIAPDLEALAVQKKQLALLEEQRQQKARELQEVRRMTDDVISAGASAASFHEGIDMEAPLEGEAASPEAIAESAGEGDGEAALEALKKNLAIEEETIKTLEKEREAFREQAEFFKGVLELVADAKREAAEAGHELTPEKREELIAHCQPRENSETFLQDINHYAGDKVREVSETVTEYSHPDVKTTEEFVDALLKKPVEQLEERIEVVETILSKDALGEAIAGSKKRVEEQGKMIEKVDKELEAAKSKPAPPVAEAPAAAEEVSDEGEETEEDDAESSES